MRRQVIAALASLAVATSAAAETASQGPAADAAAVATIRAKSAALSPADRSRASSLFSSAFKLWQAGDFGAAEIGFEEGLGLDPANGPANFYYGDILKRKADARALTFMARAAAFSPDSPEGLKAKLALREGQTQQADAARATEAAARADFDARGWFVGTWGITVRCSYGSGSVRTVIVPDGDQFKAKGGGFSAVVLTGRQFHMKYANFLGNRLEFIGALVGPTTMSGTYIQKGETCSFEGSKRPD